MVLEALPGSRSSLPEIWKPHLRNLIYLWELNFELL